MKPLTDRVKATAVDYNTENMGAERVLRKLTMAYGHRGFFFLSSFKSNVSRASANPLLLLPKHKWPCSIRLKVIISENLF
jgi:hypothetical protein